MIRHDAVERFGLLSEAVQVKAAIALADVTRRGMRLEQERLDAVRTSLLRRRDELVLKQA